MTLTWLDVGYSTSRRHGGPHANFFGGSLPSALTLLADAEIVMYLDDDDWLHEEHCADILKAIQGKKWAFAYSIYADGESGAGVHADEIESLGVDQGAYAKSFGGFVRPSGMAINKLQLLPIVHLWACAAYDDGDGADRLIFNALRDEPHGCTGMATMFYALDLKDARHADRVAFMRSKGVDFTWKAKADSIR